MIYGERRGEVSSFAEFASYVEGQAPPGAIFRGHARGSWKLVPEVHGGDAITASTPADRVNAEKSMLREFQRQVRPHLPNLPKDDWEWLAFARHYGMPTRFLDWTENAAAALFFAVELPNDNSESAIWCSERPREVTEGKSPFEVDDIYLYAPPHISPRITAQSAYFTVHPTDYIGRRYRWPCDLIKLIVSAKARVLMRATLRAHGIHRASLFPEPAGIAEEIRRRYYSSMEDEQDLLIISAWYGSGADVVEVSEALRSRAVDGKLRVRVDNELAKDPCPGVRKELRVIYSFLGRRRKKAVPEDEELTLP
jgi:FRG domain